MAKKKVEITFEEWEEKYTPVKNDQNEIRLYETYGEDETIVDSVNIFRVWTLIDGDDGKTYLVSGKDKVNILNFIITEKLRDFEEEIVFEY